MEEIGVMALIDQFLPAAPFELGDREEKRSGTSRHLAGG